MSMIDVHFTSGGTLDVNDLILICSYVVLA